MKFLIVYGTRRGQTAKIANVIGRAIREQGDEATVVDGSSPPSTLIVDQYDAIIIGASVHSDQFQPYITEFIRDHLDHLRRRPSAFFSVSLDEADPDPKRHARVTGSISRLLSQTGWQPDTVESFAGSLAIPRHRWLIHLVGPRVPLPANTTPEGHGPPNYEYTDWEAVRRFTAAFVANTHATLAAPIPA